MKPEYQDWINAFHEREPYALGQCHSATKAMREVFPELVLAKGHVYTIWGKRGHWWLKTTDGEIVDPTAHQFESIFEYEEWQPGDEVCIGKCMDCGNEIWETLESLEDVTERSFCDEGCERMFRHSLMQRGSF